ncbi:MAG: hypothetical protein Q8O73_05875 [Thalassospira sp.]|nr:hypothetical protein [Thalassospira sp.]
MRLVGGASCPDRTGSHPALPGVAGAGSGSVGEADGCPNCALWLAVPAGIVAGDVGLAGGVGTAGGSPKCVRFPW